MSRFTRELVAFVLLTLCVGIIGETASVVCRAADPAAPTTAPSTQPVAVNKPVNSKCLVAGDDIDPNITVVYKGVTYGFCCQDCVQKFNANPEKYIAAAK